MTPIEIAREVNARICENHGECEIAMSYREGVYDFNLNAEVECINLATEQYQARVRVLEELLAECADDIEAEVEAKRGSVLPRTTERDLDIVRRARTALASMTGDGE